MSAYDDFCDWFNVTVVAHEIGGEENMGLINKIFVPRDNWRDIESGIYTALRSGSPFVGIGKVSMTTKDTDEGSVKRGAIFVVAKGGHKIIIETSSIIENPYYTVHVEDEVDATEEKLKTEKKKAEKDKLPSALKKSILDDDDDDDDETRDAASLKKAVRKIKTPVAVADSFIEAVGDLVDEYGPGHGYEMMSAIHEAESRTITITIAY